MTDREQLRVEFEETGLDRVYEGLASRLSEHLRGHPLLAESDHRLLRAQLTDRDDPEAKDRGERAPYGVLAEVYDYGNERALQVSGPLDALDAGDLGSFDVRDVAYQPVPTPDELAVVDEVVRADRELGRLIEGEGWSVYHPMPPVALRDLHDGRTERVVTAGLADREGVTRRLVGVRLRDRVILDDLRDLPHELERVCEPARPDDGCPGTGDQGQVWVNVWYGGERVWRFLVVRPAASSGTNGSGVELRYVDFRGRRLLYRAHVPILNVEYFAEGERAGCGPTYRDWQNQEACFDAPPQTDFAPGIRLCSGPARTIIESGSDTGNFRGVGIYVDGLEVVLVSELAAGWYRYISQWRLHVDGTVRPRFGFAATANPCTCLGHHHHVYWRLDLDVDGAAPNRVEEFNDPPLVGGGNWHAKAYEIRRLRDAARGRRWRVTNPASGAAYVLVPGAQDGAETAYGVGDLWILRYRGTELDDGQGFTTDPALSRARLDPFRIPAEPVFDQDVVLWYAAHFLHDEAHGHPGGHYVGPDLVPENWRG